MIYRVAVLHLAFVILSGCATYYNQKEFDAGKEAKLNSPACVRLVFWRNEYDIRHEVTETERFWDYDASQFEQKLRPFNLLTKCENPVAKYDVIIGMRNKYVLLKTFWGIVSISSLGIIPFFTDDSYNIVIERDRDVIGDIWVSNTKVFSIFLIGKMFSDDSSSFEAFGSDIAHAMLNIKIAEVLKKDIDSVKAKN